MPFSIAPRRLTPSRARRLTAAAVLVGMLAAGCGGSPRTPTAPGGGASTSASSVASGTGVGGPGSTAQGTGASPLAFARCMRASGVPDFPDPNSSGGFDFQAGAGAISSPALKAAQAKCDKLLPGGGAPGPGSATHPSAQTILKLLRIAQCMRRHGVPQFPDPRTTVPSNRTGIREITDYDGAILIFPSTINMQAPAYRQALTSCGAPPLGLPH